MNALDMLADRLRAAAAKPPAIIRDRVVNRSLQILSTSVADSTGRRRPIVRQTLAQQKYLTERARGRTLEQARESVIAQAKEQLT